MHLKHKLIIFAGIVSAIAVAVSAALMGGLAGATPGGPNCNVPGDYSTIQAAVDTVGCSTIKVGPGTYNESVTINRSVKLKGAKAGHEVKNRTFGNPGESTVDGSTPGQAAFIVNAPNVVINGFSITNPDETLGVIVKTAGNEAKIRNNIIDGVGNASLTSPTVGLYLEYGPDSVKISGNKINNIKSGTQSAQGVLVGDSTSSNPSLDTEVDGNTVTSISSVSKGAYGIQVNNGARTDASATGYTEIKVRANTIKDLTGNWAHAIGLEGETPNAVVRYNIVSNLTDTNPSPIADAVGVNFDSNPFFFTVTINRNDINVGPVAFGVAVNPALTAAYPSLSVDAECNYWGSNNGPGLIASGSGSLVGSGVDYSPWLKSSNLDGKCGNKWGKDKDNDHHHGDYDCKYDDRRDWKYQD